jgi:WD40 repeat protein
MPTPIKRLTLIAVKLVVVLIACSSGFCAERVVVTDLRAVTLPEPVGRIASLAFSPDGSVLAAGSGTVTSFGSHGEITLWDWRTGSVIKTLEGHGGLVEDVVFSKDGQWIVGGGFNLKIWDGRTYKLIKRLPNKSLVHAIALTSDRKTLVTAARGLPYATVWNLEKGIEVSRLPAQTFDGQTLEQSGQTVVSLHLSRDNTLLAMGGYEQLAAIWNVADWRLKKTVSLEAKGTNCIRFVRLAHSRPWVFTKGDSEVPGRIFNMESGALVSELKGGGALLNKAAFSRADDLLVAVGMDDARIWDTASGKLLWSHRGSFCSVAFSPDGRTVALGYSDGRITLLTVKVE